jgi:hypothetical protein
MRSKKIWPQRLRLLKQRKNVIFSLRNVFKQMHMELYIQFPGKRSHGDQIRSKSRSRV